MKRSMTFLFAAVMAAVLAPAAGASTFEDSPLGVPGYSGYQGGSSTVPVSALGMPSKWIDPSRMHVSTSFTFGSSSGFGSSGLQVTSLSYQFGAPLQMRVSVGNAFGSGVQNNGQFFLEGLDIAYQPFKSMTIQVNYRDIRSPLQMPYGYGLGLDPWYSDRSRLIVP